MPSPDRLRIAVIGTGVSGLSRGLAPAIAPRRDGLREGRSGWRAFEHGLRSARRRRGSRRHRLHRLQRRHLSQFCRIVASPRRRNLRDRTCPSPPPSTAAGSNIPGRASPASSASAPISSVRNSGGCSPISSASTARATRDARRAIAEETSLGDYLAAGRFGAAFRDHHIVPMASAIWSAAPAEILDYPAAVVPALPRQSRAPPPDRPADLAHRGRRKPRLRDAPGRAARRAHPGRGGRGSRRADRRARRGRRRRGPAGRVRPRGDRHARRRGARPSGRARRRGSGRCSARSATAATRRTFISTRR